MDESGRFQHPDPDSRFYIVSLVLHDQTVDLSSALDGLDLHFRDLHLEKLCFHAGPLIRQEKVFAVKPESYRLFQIADLVCTVKFIEEKIRSGEGMTPSEFKFFGGPKEFRHNILRYIKAKEI